MPATARTRPASAKLPSARESRVGRVIAVKRAKGGVGPRARGRELACALARQGPEGGTSGMLISTGPNVPTMLGVADEPLRCAAGPTAGSDPIESAVWRWCRWACLIQENTGGPGGRGDAEWESSAKFLYQGGVGGRDVLVVDLTPGTVMPSSTLAQAVSNGPGVVMSPHPERCRCRMPRGRLAMFCTMGVSVLG